LRQPGALIDQAGADAELKWAFLVREILARRFQPGQYLPPHRIGQRLVDCINVHGDVPTIYSSMSEINIVINKFKNRYFTIYFFRLLVAL
jgi:hypothetical protein